MTANSVPVTLERSRARRLAFPLIPATVRAIVPARAIGAYLLLQGDRPVYVGRSDRCVRARLAAHPLLHIATHFIWEPCSRPLAAFFLESLWFHRLSGQSAVLNLAHPASPEFGVRCLVCREDYGEALVRALKFS